MKINWKSIIGILLIFGALSELFRIIKIYNEGSLDFWPTGAILGSLFMVALGAYMIDLGNK